MVAGLFVRVFTAGNLTVRLRLVDCSLWAQ